jgi:CCR4-NOT complex subunit CAF16
VAPTISVKHLTFQYPKGTGPTLRDVSLDLEPGTRTLLLGKNGAGKSTLLHILAGKHLVPQPAVRVLGRAAFHDTTLAADVSFLGGQFRFDVDIAVADILARAPGIDLGRRDRLIELLGIDPGWHMHRVSDGQRRRVQILLGLLRPAQVLLLDEVTTDLDLLVRCDLLEFLQAEAEQRGATLVYATHILDGMAEWATHLLFLRQGRVERHQPIAEVPELRGKSLFRAVEGWLRAEST